MKRIVSGITALMLSLGICTAFPAGAGEGTNASFIVSAAESMAAVNVRAVSSSSDTVTIAWDHVKGACSYTVYMYNSQKKEYECVGTTYTDRMAVRHLKYNSSYKFKVAADRYDDSGISEFAVSKEVSCRTKNIGRKKSRSPSGWVLDPANISTAKLWSYDSYEPRKAYLLQDIGDGIYVYGVLLGSGINDKSYIVIDDNGSVSEIEQNWLGGYCEVPEFAAGDFDGDGKKEIASTLLVGTGTMCSEHDLKIYEKNKKGKYRCALLLYNNYYAEKDETVYDRKIISVVKSKIKISIDRKKKTFTFSSRGSRRTLDYSDKEEYIDFSVMKKDMTFIGSISYFSFDGDRIYIYLIPCLPVKDAAIPLIFDEMTVYAEIKYKNGGFTVGDVTIV